MTLLRNILTAIWCAIVIGTNVFGLMVLVHSIGWNAIMTSGAGIWALKLVLMAGFALLSLMSTKFLWVVLAVAVFWTLLGIGFDLIIARAWRSPSVMTLLVNLFMIVPTYLLARWNSAASKTNFNPVKEF